MHKNKSHLTKRHTHIFFPILLSMENTCFLKNVMVPLYIHNVTLLMRYIKQLLFSFKNNLQCHFHQRIQKIASFCRRVVDRLERKYFSAKIFVNFLYVLFCS